MDREIASRALAAAYPALTAEVEALRARVAELEAWRPWGGAPTDREIDVYRPDAGIFLAAWRSAVDGLGDDTGEECWFTSNGEDLTGDLPTHWRERPRPPRLEAIDRFVEENSPPVPQYRTDLMADPVYHKPLSAAESNAEPVWTAEKEALLVAMSEEWLSRSQNYDVAILRKRSIDAAFAPREGGGNG